MDLEGLLRDRLEQKTRANATKSANRANLTEPKTFGRKVDTDPACGATFTMSVCRGYADDPLYIGQRLDDLNEQISKAKAGDLSDLEASLIAQASVLQAQFNQLSQIGFELLGGKFPAAFQQFEALMHLALRAQDQSRKTVLAIAELKNPKKSTFIKQQLNQLAIAQPTEPTPQLKEAYGSPIVDTRAETAATGTDPDLAAVVKINRTSNGNRQAKK